MAQVQNPVLRIERKCVPLHGLVKVCVETEETADYGGGFYACEPQGGPDGGDIRAREAGFNEDGAPQIEEGL